EATAALAILGGQSDKEVLLELKNLLQVHNPINRCAYDDWSESDASPCHWEGVGCDATGHVDVLDLSSSNISSLCYGKFSRLTHLDLSANSITGELGDDLKRCQSLRYLNLSNNLIGGILDVSGLANLHTLDVSQNRFQHTISVNFPAICSNLTFFSVASNNLTGRIDGLLDRCSKLRNVDLSRNSFSGTLWPGVSRLSRFSANDNKLTGFVSSGVFATGCRLQYLNIASNYLHGNFPSSIANCTGPIPKEIGNCTSLLWLNIAGNRLSGGIPPEMAPKNCRAIWSRLAMGYDPLPVSSPLRTALGYVQLSGNLLSGEIPSSIGRMRSISLLLLADNGLSGSLPSEIVQLNLVSLDVSNNDISGEVPDNGRIRMSSRRVVV
ncbi:putative LRR receptor-like serine/threonine-protein kinase, partial [Dichanthelium oligosanthes]